MFRARWPRALLGLFGTTLFLACAAPVLVTNTANVALLRGVATIPDRWSAASGGPLAHALKQAGEWRSLHTLLEARGEPLPSWARFRLAEAQWHLAQHDTSVANYVRVGAWRTLRDLADEAARAGRWSEADMLYDAALHAGEHRDEAPLLVGGAWARFMARRDAPAALAMLHRAASVEPNNFVPWLLIGDISTSVLDSALAASAYQEALRLGAPASMLEQRPTVPALDAGRAS
jgi:hypothetical protein